MSGFGSAKYGGEYKKRQYRKLKDGDSVFRILPPVGDLAAKGIWSVFYNVHYGYKNSKGQMRCFQSPQVKNRTNNMIEVADSALDRIKALKSQMEAAKASGNKDLFKKLDELVGIKGQFNMDNNHHLNAIDDQGNVVILKLRHRAKLALDATIKRLREGGVDPLSLENGRFFIFRRTGSGLDTSFQVEVKKRKILVDGIGEVEQDEVHKIDPATAETLAKEVASLDSLYKRPTADEVTRIVKEGVSAVDEIFDTKASAATTTDASYSDDTGHDDEDVTPQTAAPAQSVAQAVSAAASQAAQAAPAAPALGTTAAKADSMSTDDFLKTLGV